MKMKEPNHLEIALIIQDKVRVTQIQPLCLGKLESEQDPKCVFFLRNLLEKPVTGNRLMNVLLLGY